MKNLRKEPIRLRMKPLKNGGYSLYLDIYYEGVRSYEFLHLYLSGGDTKAEKVADDEILRLANAIKSKRMVEMHNDKHGFSNAKLMADADFLSYMEMCGQRAAKHGKASTSLRHNVIKLLKEFTRREQVPFKMITKEFLEKFAHYLQTTTTKGSKGLQFKESPRRYSAKTTHTYFATLMCDIKKAYRDEFMNYNPVLRLHSEDIPKDVEVEKSYLTEDELKKMAAYPLLRRYGPFVKSIFLFGCMTGLRYSDIVSLKWENITIQGDTYQLSKKQVKTENVVSFPLSRASIALLPKRGQKKGSDYVFGEQCSFTTVQNWMRKWAKAAGVSKHVSFHVSRHTFATLILSKGADLYTVSKLLGHQRVETTQIYAKVVDESKRKAIGLIDDVL